MPSNTFSVGNEFATSENSFGSTSSNSGANPFNDSSSGFGDSSSESNSTIDSSIHSHGQQYFMPDLKAFSNNYDKLDGILNHFNGSNVDGDAKNVRANPFLISGTKSPALNELKGTGFSASLPEPGQYKRSDGNRINYDSLRETIDSEVLNTSCPPQLFGSSGGGVTTAVDRPGVAVDLFKDAAAAAFSEFGSTNDKGRKHEFFNKISSVNRVPKTGPDAFNGSDLQSINEKVIGLVLTNKKESK